MVAEGKGVFIIYTGGTLGSLPKDENDPMSPLVSKDLAHIMKRIPNYVDEDKKIFINGKWIKLGTYSWPIPIDSSNVTSKDWEEIARKILESYNEWEGFVVLHGTDTMAYTSSALAFMLDNLSKPVVITGSQRPIGETRSDAVQNLVTAIEIAASATMGYKVIPEVTVFFRDHLYRGCRTTKLSASEFNAFNSPNLAPLAKAGEHISINEPLVRSKSNVTLSLNDKLEKHIASLDIFPGMSTELLENMLKTKNLKGVILQTFGTGNAPTTANFLDVIGRAVLDGKLIVDVTQCRSGEVELGLYDVSAGLLSRGVVSGMDMTPEAALTKLGVVLGKTENVQAAADMMQINLKGEQRQSIFNMHYPAGNVDYENNTITLSIERPMVQGHEYNSDLLDKAIFRIMGVRLVDQKRGRLELKAYIGLPDANEDTPEEGNPHFLGKTNKKYDETESDVSVFMKVDNQALGFVDPRHPPEITIVGLGAPFHWNKLNLALFVDK